MSVEVAENPQRDGALGGAKRIEDTEIAHRSAGVRPADLEYEQRRRVHTRGKFIAREGSGKCWRWVTWLRSAQKIKHLEGCLSWRASSSVRR